VNISTSSFDAGQGMAGGAAITVISSSGANQLHGALWEYHENQRLRSQPYFRSSAFVKPRYTLNIFGANAGSAIVKNKLFWFGHYEGTRQGTGATSQFSLPNAAIKAGDFSAFPTQIFDPATANAEGFGRTPFPGNRIPANRISPQTARILPSIPEPNFPTPNVTANHFVNATGKFDRGNYDAKMNWNRNEKHSVFAKFSLLRANVGGVFAFGPNLGGPGGGGDPGLSDTKQYLGTVGTNYTISPTLLFDANWGITEQDQSVIGFDYGKNYGSEVFGIPGTNGTDIRYSGLPSFSFNTFTAYGIPLAARSRQPARRLLVQRQHHGSPRRCGGQQPELVRRLPARLAHLHEQERASLPDDRPRTATRLLRPRSRAGQPQAHRQHRSPHGAVPPDEACELRPRETGPVHHAGPPRRLR